MATGLARLRERDLRAALHAVQSLADQSEGSKAFVDGALDQLTGIVASDLTTLSICDLERGARRVVGRKAETLSDADRAAFDQHFREHPLVRFHSSHPGGPTQRISDCWTGQTFRNSALHTDYYRWIGINYVMALPLRIDNANVISIVFNRSSSDFKEDERAILDAIRQPLAALYRNLIAYHNAGIALKCITQLAADGGWQLLQVTLSGRILEATPAALRLLQRFFPSEHPAHRPYSRRRCSRGLRIPATGGSSGQQLTTASISPWHGKVPGYSCTMFPNWAMPRLATSS